MEGSGRPMIETNARENRHLVGTYGRFSEDARHRSAHTSRSNGLPVSPLTEHFYNIAPSGGRAPRGEIGGGKKFEMAEVTCESDGREAKLRHNRITSIGHRRRPSSISVSDFTPHTLRTSAAITSLTSGTSSTSVSPVGPPLLPASASSQTAVPPHTTFSSFDPVSLEEHAQNAQQDAGRDDIVRDRLAGFTFGGKGVSGGVPPTSNGRSLPSRSRPLSQIHTPISSISSSRTHTILSDPSRPPSLLVTRPPQSPTSALNDDQSSPPPPTPARVRKHSHTRSNSISLPNLKTSGRPPSLNAIPALSFPSSPVSPDENTPPSGSRVTTSRKLKFEPSGRGAEADKQKEESRRRALEKLTGVAGQPETVGRISRAEDISKHATIALPEEEETTAPSLLDRLAAASPGTPFASELTTPLPDDPSPSPIYHSSTSSPASSPADPSSSQPSPWSFLRSSPAFRDDTLGFDLGAAAKRVSVNSGLGVLEEEDENEAEPNDGLKAGAEVGKKTMVGEDTVYGPTPTRLRQLHLLASPTVESPIKPSSGGRDISLATSSPTPTPLTRARPSPLQHAPALEPRPSCTSPPFTVGDDTTTPHRRRQSRGSLSYKRTQQNRDEVQSSGTLSVDDVITPLPSSSALPSATHSSISGWLGSSSGSHSQAWPDWSHLSSTPRWSAPTAPTSSSTVLPVRSPQRDDSISFDWQGSSLDIALQRDALQEDLDVWRTRCLAAEEKLEAERKERAILQSRIRKLGDRLTSVSSVVAPALHETTITTELRQQLFSAASQLDRERREKVDALARVAELERGLAHLVPQSAAPPLLPSQRLNDIYHDVVPAKNNSDPPKDITASQVSTLASPTLPSPDPNLDRMKGWGFPPPPREKSPPKDRKRESFFGLSASVTPSIEHGGFAGIDLPPFALPAVDNDGRISHTPQFQPEADERNPVVWHPDCSAKQSTSIQQSRSVSAATLDLSFACRCCTGDVFNM